MSLYLMNKKRKITNVCEDCKNTQFKICEDTGTSICVNCGVCKPVFIDGFDITHNEKKQYIMEYDNQLGFNPTQIGNIKYKRVIETGTDHTKYRSEKNKDKDENEKHKNINENNVSNGENGENGENDLSYKKSDLQKLRSSHHLSHVMLNNRKETRFKNIYKIINERRDIWRLSDIDIRRVCEIYNRMKLKHHPRTIELHALVLVALATRESSQISYNEICASSHTISTKELISFVKKTCDNMNISRPLSNPIRMILKHISKMGLTKKQGLRSEKIIRYLLLKQPSLHPMTHMAVSILIAIKTVDQDNILTKDLTFEHISCEINTTASTLENTYERLKTNCPILFNTKNKLKISR